MSICSECKGMCCVKVAGIYSPEDFKELTIDYLLEKINTGKYAIDFGYYDTGKVYKKIKFIRPRHKFEEKIIQNDNIFGVCINWSYENGCSLSEKERPYQCLKLIPLIDGKKCDTHPEDNADKKSMVLRWVLYQDLINEVINKLDETKFFIKNEKGYYLMYAEYLKNYRIGGIKINKNGK